MNEDLEVRPGLMIPSHELAWSYVASGGPGGQHANRSNTKAVLKFAVAESSALTAGQKALLLKTLPTTVVIEVNDTRSQWQNRRLARERLAEKLRTGLKRKAPRRATKPSAGAKRRRLSAKRRRSETKQSRRRPRMDD